MKNVIVSLSSRMAKNAILVVAALSLVSVTSLFGGSFSSKQKTQNVVKAYEGCSLPAMQNLRLVGRTEVSFTLAWDAVAGSAGYYLKIYRLNTDGSIPTTPVQVQLAESVEATFSRLLPGTYRIEAAAVCEQEFRNLQTRSTPPTGEPTTTNIIIDEIVLLKTLNVAGTPTQARFIVMDKQAVSLGVFDITGRKVISIYNNKILTEGIYDEELRTQGLNTGIYFLRLQVGQTVKINKFSKM